MDAKTKPAPRKIPAVKCASLADVDELLGELATMEARRKSIENDVGTKIKEISDAALHLMTVRIDGQDVKFADRAKAIQATLETWCAAHRADVLPDWPDAKSRALNNGSVGWKKAVDRIDGIKGQPAAGNADVLDAISAHLRRALDRFAEVARALHDCLVIQVKWGKAPLKKAVDESKISPAELRSIGFKHVEGEDEFFAEPCELSLESLPSA